MILLKDVDEANKLSALDVMNRLKEGDRVFGNPAEGLKKTMKKLEDELDKQEKEKDALDYLDKSGDLRSNISMLKSGITGEEELAEFLEIAIKEDEKLQDCIVFASLSDPNQNSGGDEYISDSDFIFIYGQDILIVDAKNIRTTPQIPIYLAGNSLVSANGAVLLEEINPSVKVWEKIFKKNHAKYNSIHGCTVIVNKQGALIWRNQEWYDSEIKPVHISELVDFLHEWIEGKSNKTSLNTLAVISNMQIKEDTANMDFSYAKRMFNI